MTEHTMDPNNPETVHIELHPLLTACIGAFLFGAVKEYEPEVFDKLDQTLRDRKIGSGYAGLEADTRRLLDEKLARNDEEALEMMEECGGYEELVHQQVTKVGSDYIASLLIGMLYDISNRGLAPVARKAFSKKSELAEVRKQIERLGFKWPEETLATDTDVEEVLGLIRDIFKTKGDGTIDPELN